MKNLTVILFVFSIGLLSAQSTSKKEKKYQRYENGELVEDKYYLEKDGKAIEGTDFEMPEMDIKMAEMEQRMKTMQSDMSLRMESRMSEMNKRMEEMQQRSLKMQEEMQKRMNKSMNNSMRDMQRSQEPIDQVKPSSTSRVGFKRA